MPSFTRRAPTTQSKPAPLGTIPSLSATQPPLYLFPTGIPSIDDLLGGGIPLSGIYGILSPDRHTAWSRLVTRYWISQGLSTGQESIIVGQDETVKELVKGSMWIDERYGEGEGGEGAGSESEGEGMSEGAGKGGTKIAWRYEKMKKFQTTINKGGGRELNLMSQIPSDLLAHLEKTGVQKYIPVDDLIGTEREERSVGWGVLKRVLGKIAEELEGTDEKTAIRLVMYDLGSQDWGSPTSQEILRFLHSLRGLINGRPVGVLVTFPADLSRGPAIGSSDLRQWTDKLGWTMDALIELKGFGDDPTLPPLFHPLHGLISLPRLPTTHHLLPPSFKHSSLLGLAGSGGSGGAGENNLGFRLKRKRFVVETVHLGIEGGTGERRTEPKPELGSLVGATKSTGPSEGIEGVERSGQKEGSEAVEKVEEPLVRIGREGVDGMVKPKGPEAEKKRKPRARVRFGGEEDLGPEVQIGEDKEPGHDHSHHDHGHDHSQHASTGQSQPGRPIVRHDRPDLYEF